VCSNVCDGESGVCISNGLQSAVMAQFPNFVDDVGVPNIMVTDGD